jgi:metal-responsive CopG/Arc/MetJ family transcriptional regulator
MASVKVDVTLDQETLRRLDRLVARRVFPNRSRAVEAALRDKLERLEGDRPAECAALDSAFERALAEEEGLGADSAWRPEF